MPLTVRPGVLLLKVDQSPHKETMKILNKMGFVPLFPQLISHPDVAEGEFRRRTDQLSR